MEMQPTAHDTTHPLRPSKWWQEPASDATLSEHIIDKLTAAGFATVEDIRAAPKSKIMQVEGIGKVAFTEICEWLKALDRDAD